MVYAKYTTNVLVFRKPRAFGVLPSRMPLIERYSTQMYTGIVHFLTFHISFHVLVLRLFLLKMLTYIHQNRDIGFSELHLVLLTFQYYENIQCMLCNSCAHFDTGFIYWLRGTFKTNCIQNVYTVYICTEY